MAARVRLRLVLDTNVLLSLWVFADSRYAPLLDLIEAGALLALCREDCLAEFARVLGYPEFDLPEAAQRGILAEYAGIVGMVGAAGSPLPLPRCRDGDDQKFLELAQDGAADFLVTSDKALLALARHRSLAGRFRIVTPERLMAELQAARLAPGTGEQQVE